MLEPDVVFREFASEIGKVTPWPQAMTGRTSAVMAALHKVAQSTPTGARKIYYRSQNGERVTVRLKTISKSWSTLRPELK